MKPVRSSDNAVLLGVVACFVLSGFAALLYQTAWMRQFSLVFGTSELAIAAVLAAYMAGLSLGASVAARLVHRITRPIFFYGLLEAGIALSALAVPWLLKLARIFYVAIWGGQSEPMGSNGLGQSFFYLAFAFIVLVIPTAFMGATLPLLTKYVVTSKEQIGSRVGMLYATNTLGAITGTLVAGFILLPLLGLNGTVWVGVIVNLVIFVLAAMLAMRIENHIKPQAGDDSVPTEDLVQDSSERRIWILPLILVSGANSFVYEVLWTRLLGHILGGSITAFATMLAGFLGGIAVGSAIASRFAATREQATSIFVVTQCGIALASMGIYQFLPFIIPDGVGLKGNIGFAILVLLPATIFIGATFPLAVRILASGKSDAAPSSARIYSWNTIGAIIGAVSAAFFLIPMLKYEGTIKAAVMLNTILAFMAAFWVSRRRRLFLSGASVFVLVVLFFYQPRMPEEILRASPVFPQPGGEIVFYEVGRSATVVVIEENGLLYLRTNGLPEAAATLKGAPPARGSQQMLSVLPVLARPEADSTLIIGLGAGIAIEAVPPSVTDIDVIELEQEVLRANEFYGDRRANDPLRDPRISITINDARNALSLTDKKYDSIVSQPSHPWTAGASHLYTREFMALARDHLKDGGVYLQWMNSGFVDESLLKSLCATMLDVFAYVRMYQFDPGVILFLGSDELLEPEVSLAVSGKPINDDVLWYQRRGMGAAEDLLIGLAMDQENIENFAKNAELTTDNNNLMATKSALISDSATGLTPEDLSKVISDYDPLIQAGNWVEDLSSLNLSYISNRLGLLGSHQRSLNLTERLFIEGNPQAYTAVGLALQSQGNRQDAQQNLLRALSLNPDDQQSRYALLLPWFAALFGDGEAPEDILLESENLSGAAAHVFAGLKALESNDMGKLVDLDAELAAVQSTDLWYTTSVKLRADWRIQLTNPEYRPRMLGEAIALLDSAIAMSMDLQLYMMRIRASYLAEDYAGSMETVRSALRLIREQVDRLETSKTDINDTTVTIRIAQLDEISKTLFELGQRHEITKASLSSAQGLLEDLNQRLYDLR